MKPREILRDVAVALDAANDGVFCTGASATAFERTVMKDPARAILDCKDAADRVELLEQLADSLWLYIDDIENDNRWQKVVDTLDALGRPQ